jgi:hypothetical protein
VGIFTRYGGSVNWNVWPAYGENNDLRSAFGLLNLTDILKHIRQAPADEMQFIRLSALSGQRIKLL